VDKDAFAKGCRIILNKVSYSPFIVGIYFQLIFNYYHNSPQNLIQKFEGNQELLEEIYFAMLRYDNHHDYDGSFLRVIYLTNPPILGRYIEYLIDTGNTNSEQSRFFFELDDFIEVFIQIFNALVESFPAPIISLSHYLEAILLPHANKPELFAKQDTIIKRCIQSFSNENEKMRCLFDLIAKLPQNRRISYWLLFFEHNQSYEDFKELPLTPTSWGGVGSFIPTYYGWIGFLEELTSHFTGLRWIEHKRRTEEAVRRWKREIEKEQVDEILRG